MKIAYAGTKSIIRCYMLIISIPGMLQKHIFGVLYHEKKVFLISIVKNV